MYRADGEALGGPRTDMKRSGRSCALVWNKVTVCDARSRGTWGLTVSDFDHYLGWTLLECND